MATADWNPNDPDATVVHYDLAGWSFEQQAEVAAEMAEAEIPHAWDGVELLVPEEAEEQTDALLAELEVRLGVVSLEDSTILPAADSDPDADSPDEAGADAGEPPQAIALADGEPGVEYDLTEWTANERELVATALIVDGIAHRWEDHLVVVAADSEAAVDTLLDMVENGQIEFEDDGDASEKLPFETLTTFFLAGDRLRRNPMNAEGLAELVKAFEVAEPENPPYGVAPRLWQRTCELAEELVAALVDGDTPDHDLAAEVADELHALLRPYV